jgi:hypothetical protein
MIEAVAEMIRMFGELMSYLFIGAVALFGIALSFMVFFDRKNK